MTFTRALSKQICRMLIGVLLFAQFAVASYACPSLLGMQAMGSGVPMSAIALGNATAVDDAPESAAMPPGCDQIDQDAANLCAEHCRYGQQSADTAPVPAVAAPAPALLYLLPVETEPILGSARALPASDPVLVVRPPSHAILHCVYRI
ncbi:hypothetical protein [Ideonella sp. YS5]|uniref:hypothetical protein n=1 Tax=Ideonella sp. YS5 TaxID=3453714 RepID=UPI003EEF6E5A